MKDLGWKLLSIAIAAIMWFMVINITQPVDTRNYSRPLVIENMEALSRRGLTAGNMEELKNTKISVKVKAQRTALDRLNQNPEWIQASLDLSELAYAVNGEIVALPVDVAIQNSATYGISGKSPSVVEVKVETLASKEMPVEVMLNGLLDNNMHLSEPTLSNETVNVTGPVSAVEKVNRVQAIVNTMDLKENPVVRTELLCMDARGEIVKGVATSVPEVTISYALHEAKQIPIHIEITGTPASGYQVSNIICSPKYAEVTGSPADLEELVYLQLDSIDVSAHRSNITQTFFLPEYMPEGITLMTEGTDTVQVTVEISPQSNKRFTLPASQLKFQGEEDDKTYTLHGDAHITITGEDLDHIRAEELQGTIHVSGLEEGEHRVMVHVNLPHGYIMDPAYITVTVTDAPASTEE